MSGCSVWSLRPTPANLRTSPRRSAPAAPPSRWASDPFGVIGVLLPEALVRAENVVLRHVGRIAAGRRLAAKRLGHGADVMRPGTAADAEIADVERQRRLGELGDLEAVAGERIERDRERLG